MTLQQVGDVFGISRGSVSSWESGANTPDPRKLSKLAECLGSTVEFLVTGNTTDSIPNSFSTVEFYEWGQIGHARKPSDKTELATAIHIPLSQRAFATRYPGPTKLQAPYPPIPPGALIFIEPDLKPTTLNTVFLQGINGNFWISLVKNSTGNNKDLQVVDELGAICDINSKVLHLIGVITEWRISSVLL